MFRRVFVLISIFSVYIFGQTSSSLVYKFEKIQAFTNVTIYTDYKTKIDSATLMIQSGKIIYVGKKTIIPAGAEIIDCSHKIIYPSFVDMYTDYGVGSIKSPSGLVPHYETTVKGAYAANQAIKPEIEADKYFKHDVAKAKILRDLGFGTVLTTNKDGIVKGEAATVLLHDGPESESIIDKSTALVLSFNKGSSTQEYPSSLMGSIALLRQTFYDAQWYKFNKSKTIYDISLDKLSTSMYIPWLFDAGNSLNAIRASKIASEFNAKVVLHASGDEYQNLKQLKNLKAHWLVSLNFPEAFKIASPADANYLSNNQLMEWYFAPFNIYYLSKENIDFSLTTNHLKEPKDFLKNLQRVFETEVSENQILKALTYNPSMQLNIFDKVGSLQTGKLANFLICNKTISSKDFKIYENWVKGEKYTVIPESKDFSGKYQLSISGFKPFNMEVSGGDKQTVNVTYDTIKIPATISTSHQSIQLSLVLTKIDSMLKNKVYITVDKSGDSKYDGLASSISFSGQQRLAEITLLQLNTSKVVDTLKAAIKKPLFSLPIPFSAFGQDSIPQLNNYLLKNVNIWTGEQPFELKNYSVLVLNGKISNISNNIDLKKLKTSTSFKEIEASGQYLTAGIIDEHSHIAINAGVNETGQSVTSEVRIGDVINPNDVNIYRQLAGGVTTSHLLHGSANCIGGQSALINLKWGQPAEELKFKGNDPFIKFALGENVKQSNWGDRYIIRYPQTRMGVEQTIYDAFQRATEYKALKETYLKSKQTNSIAPKVDLELEALQEILEKKRFITCHSYAQSEINMLMKLADSFKFKVNTFTHILEGYKVADKMYIHGAGASSFSDWWAFKAEVKDAIPQNAAILTSKGVVTAINSDDAEMGRRLNMEAAKSVKYGAMSKEDAWKLVTLNPAKLLHIDNKVGSVKIGKDANLVLWTAEPLSVYAKVDKAFIEGVKYYDIATNDKIEVKNILLRNKLLEQLLNDKTPESQKQTVVPEKHEHYHCDTFETNR